MDRTSQMNAEITLHSKQDRKKYKKGDFAGDAYNKTIPGALVISLCHAFTAKQWTITGRCAN
jgi:hypothetical protein